VERQKKLGTMCRLTTEERGEKVLFHKQGRQRKLAGIEPTLLIPKYHFLKSINRNGEPSEEQWEERTSDISRLSTLFREESPPLHSDGSSVPAGEENPKSDRKKI